MKSDRHSPGYNSFRICKSNPHVHEAQKEYSPISRPLRPLRPLVPASPPPSGKEVDEIDSINVSSATRLANPILPHWRRSSFLKNISHGANSESKCSPEPPFPAYKSLEDGQSLMHKLFDVALLTEDEKAYISFLANGGDSVPEMRIDHASPKTWEDFYAELFGDRMVRSSPEMIHFDDAILIPAELEIDESNIMGSTEDGQSKL